MSKVHFILTLAVVTASSAGIGISLAKRMDPQVVPIVVGGATIILALSFSLWLS